MKTTYDYQGNRVKLLENGVTTFFPNKLYNTLLSGKATSTKHIFANGLDVATIEKVGATATTRYMFTDHLGGTTVVTDASSTIVETMDYYPYGALKLDTKGANYVGEKRKYIGEQYDSSSALNYLNARYYNSNRGGFISQDPVFLGDPTKQTLDDPQKLNAYSYGRDNPVRLSDPSGLNAADDQLNALKLQLIQAQINLIKLQLQQFTQSVVINAPQQAASAFFDPGAGYQAATNNSLSIPERAAGIIGGVAGVAAAFMDDGLNLETGAIKNVILETFKGAGQITSAFKLSSSELLEAGEQFLGKGYKQLDDSVFRSSDGIRQFRIDVGSITGKHTPFEPHGHFEILNPGTNDVIVNNHVPFYDNF